MTGEEYRCEKCGYNEKFQWGLAMLDSAEKYEYEENLEKEFKQEVLSGIYGEGLKQYAMLMGDKASYIRQEALFHCINCNKIFVHRRKCIFSRSEHFDEYTQETVFQQKCPYCNERWLFEVKRYVPCPVCGNPISSCSIWKD